MIVRLRSGAANWKYHLYIPDDLMPKRKKLNKAERAMLPLVVWARNVRYEPQIHEQATEAVTKKEAKKTISLEDFVAVPV